MNPKFKKTIDILSSVGLGVFVLLVVLLAGVRLFGIEPHIVTSGSMEPEIMTGSLVYVKRVTPEEAQSLQAGETVTYIINSSGTKVTHKIYEVVGPAYVKNQHGEYVLDDNGQRVIAKDDAGYEMIMYTTYGVNNKNPSSETGYTLDGQLGVGNLASSNVFGKPIFSIPFVGYVAHFVQNPPGQYITIIICVLLIVFSFFGEETQKKAKKAAVCSTPDDQVDESQPPVTEDQIEEAQQIPPEESTDL